MSPFRAIKNTSTDHSFRTERRAEADSNRGPSAYRTNALPLGQCRSHSGGDSVATGYNLPNPPPPPFPAYARSTLFSPFPISYKVYVDVKHHIYLLAGHVCYTGHAFRSVSLPGLVESRAKCHRCFGWLNRSDSRLFFQRLRTLLLCLPACRKNGAILGRELRYVEVFF